MAKDKGGLYFAAHRVFLRAARLYAHAFDRFADGDCTDIELAQSEADLDRAAKELSAAAGAANKEMGS